MEPVNGFNKTARRMASSDLLSSAGPRRQTGSNRLPLQIIMTLALVFMLVLRPWVPQHTECG